jgi:hypothetical protein
VGSTLVAQSDDEYVLDISGDVNLDLRLMML